MVLVPFAAVAEAEVVKLFLVGIARNMINGGLNVVPDDGIARHRNGALDTQESSGGSSGWQEAADAYKRLDRGLIFVVGVARLLSLFRKLLNWFDLLGLVHGSASGGDRRRRGI